MPKKCRCCATKTSAGRCRPDGTGRQADNGTTGGGTEALSEALSGGAFFYQNKDKAGYDALPHIKGLDPAEFPFETSRLMPRRWRVFLRL